MNAVDSHLEGYEMGILDGKRILVTGVLTDASIAFHVARIAQAGGRDRGAHRVRAGSAWWSGSRRRLPDPPPVLELDVTDEGHLGSLAERVSAHTDRLDGVVHAHRVRAAVGARRQLPQHPVGRRGHRGARVGLLAEGARDGGAAADGRRRCRSSAWTSTRRVAWPGYDWMGVAKAGLESCARYLARDLGRAGIRVNLVAAGPLRTMAAKSIPGFDRLRGRVGRSGRRSAGTSPIRSRPPAPAWPCCPTGSRPPPARSCTPTAEPTRSEADFPRVRCRAVSAKHSAAA